ncbi:MAG: GNAT family N-acetyltransferase [Bacilli bacterium]
MIKETHNLDVINNLTDYKVTFNPFTHVLIYELNDIVAYLDYSIIYEKIEINYIFVQEEYRHQKIAYQLLKYVIDNNLNKDNITLEVSINNEIAIKLYKHLGFNIISKRPNYYNGIDAYLMEKRW